MYFSFPPPIKYLIELMPIMPVMPILFGVGSNEGRSVHKQILKYDLRRRRLWVDPKREGLRP